MSEFKAVEWHQDARGGLIPKRQVSIYYVSVGSAREM
jgi:hypothetical protein